MAFVSRLSSLLLGALALAASSGLVLAPAAQAQDDAAGLEQMLTRINQMRSAAGVGTLARDARLDAAAQAHSADMAANDMLEHVSPRTGDPTARVAAAGLASVQVAENIALNADVLAAHAALVSSDAHRANLMNPALTHIGIAAARSSRGVYVTQVFAALAGAAAADVAALPPPAVVAPAEVAAAAPAAPTEQAAAPAPAVAVPAPQVAVPAQPGARRVAGYWVFSQSRWWYYPLPADARPGQVLQAAQLPPGAAPPGYGPQGAAGQSRPTPPRAMRRGTQRPSTGRHPLPSTRRRAPRSTTDRRLDGRRRSAGARGATADGGAERARCAWLTALGAPDAHG